MRFAKEGIGIGIGEYFLHPQRKACHPFTAPASHKKTHGIGYFSAAVRLFNNECFLLYAAKALFTTVWYELVSIASAM